MKERFKFNKQSDCRFLHENLWFYHRLGWHSAQRGDDAGQHALTNGAASVLSPTTEPWGQRTCYVADPDGNLIEIGTFTK